MPLADRAIVRALPVAFSGALSLIASSAFADQSPSFDCARAASSAETLVCNDAELAKLDRELADHFAQALAAAKEGEAAGGQSVAELRAYQRGWIKGRDDCWKAQDLRECVEASYRMRDAELVATWMLEEPINTVTWICDGDPANQVTTMFFDTDLPSVRFERGDSIDVGYLVRTGSGSRYDGSFGRYIWIKGDEATYRDPGGEGEEYTCELAAEG